MPTIEDVTAHIGPVKVRHLPGFLKACEPIAAHLMAGDVVRAFCDHADNLIEATALGADVDRNWLEDQTADVLMDLAFRVLEANLGFFVRTLLPRITEAAGRLDGIGGANGSPASSDTALDSMQ